MFAGDGSQLLIWSQLWDVCSDQEAVDLVRNVQDPQTASKNLVDHALARFSTDNLSCMIVRFDNKALQQAQESKDNLIGVEGDPASKSGGISEAEAIVGETKKQLDEGNDLAALSRPTTGEIIDEVVETQEPGPELNPEALEAARKDHKPQLDSA